MIQSLERFINKNKKIWTDKNVSLKKNPTNKNKKDGGEFSDKRI